LTEARTREERLSGIRSCIPVFYRLLLMFQDAAIGPKQTKKTGDLAAHT